MEPTIDRLVRECREAAAGVTRAREAVAEAGRVHRDARSHEDRAWAALLDAREALRVYAEGDA